MKHGILPGNIIENLPFPFSCPVTEFHKDILAVQGHHQLKTLYFCVDVRMPLWQIHKWYSDTARGQREVKDTPWWFHVPLPHKTRSFHLLIYKMDKLMWSTMPKSTEMLYPEINLIKRWQVQFTSVTIVLSLKTIATLVNYTCKNLVKLTLLTWCSTLSPM